MSRDSRHSASLCVSPERTADRRQIIDCGHAREYAGELERAQHAPSRQNFGAHAVERRPSGRSIKRVRRPLQSRSTFCKAKDLTIQIVKALLSDSASITGVCKKPWT
jgi:hypothetical protein